MIATSGNTQFSFPIMITLGFENGSFNDFRRSVESKKDSASRRATKDIWFEYQMGVGVKHKFENQQTLAGQMGVNFGLASSLGLSYFANLTYQIKKRLFINFYAMFPLDKYTDNRRIKDVFSLGFTYGF